jgi:putative spermidine/putrescine transport system permease protein
VGNTKFIGNVIYDSVGVANNVPFAAAYAMVPVAVMAVYMVLAKRAGAFEAL